ncbi:hypothetical protein BU204_25665 [Actinophytocola xanthii]|uniref:Circularly permuted ATPgrasp domain-containing protein n=1 Tax=Actinophytocola xanthii TaxID=1912961 RepID=A0A1Q8CK09_9PSEU|nr:hypothetical protein BU204_25665 [Actinophytocola xanthii]
MQSAFNDYLGPPGPAPELAALREALDATKAVRTRDDMYFTPLPAPLLLDREQNAYLRHASERLVALLTTELGTYVADEAELLDVLRIGPVLRPFVREALAADVTVARCDFLWSREGWRVVEVNIGGPVGGLDVRGYNDLAAKNPLVGPFLTENGLDAGSPIDALAEATRRACERLGVAAARPVIAIVDSPEFEPIYHLAYRRLVEHYAANGFDAVICHQGTLSVRNGHLFSGELHIDAVHRQFILEDMLTEPELALPVLQAASAGTTALISGFREELLGCKGMLAVLRDAAVRGLLSAEDAHLVLDVVPETVLLHRPDRAGFSGAGDPQVLRDATAADWVVKPSIGSSGGGVTLGAGVDEGTFRDAARAATGSDDAWVAQRFVRSDPVTLPLLRDEELTFGGCQIHPSFFVTEGRATGAWTRALPGQAARLVAMVNGALFGGVYAPH